MRDVSYYRTLPYTVILRLDDEGDYVARIDELPGCIAHGKTQQEALENLEEVKELWITDSLERGDPIPEPAEEEGLPSGKWVQRVPRSLHRKLVTLAKREKVSLNQLVTSILAEAVGVRKVDQPQQVSVSAFDNVFGSWRHFRRVGQTLGEEGLEHLGGNWVIKEPGTSPVALTTTLGFLRRQIPGRMTIKVERHGYKEIIKHQHKR